MTMSQEEINTTIRDQFATWLEEHGWPDWPSGTNGNGRIAAQVAKGLCEEAFHSGWHFGRTAETDTMRDERRSGRELLRPAGRGSTRGGAS